MRIHWLFKWRPFTPGKNINVNRHWGDGFFRHVTLLIKPRVASIFMSPLYTVDGWLNAIGQKIDLSRT
jgi:hypothetical protein